MITINSDLIFLRTCGKLLFSPSAKLKTCEMCVDLVVFENERLRKHDKESSAKPKDHANIHLSNTSVWTFSTMVHQCEVCCTPDLVQKPAIDLRHFCD